MKKAVVSVTNDLTTDQRVDKVCKTLMKCNFDVELVGRKKIDSQSLSVRAYQTHRLRLLFEKNVFFYAEYNLRLFFYLLTHKQDLLISNDLDTLLPNYLISRIKRIPLIYDSHEYFCGVPELENNKFARNVWQKIERYIFPKLKHIFTVNDSIAELYFTQYKVELKVVRNIPMRLSNVFFKSRKELNLPENKKIILLQGAGINVDRGVEELIEAMQFIDDALLLIIGGGDVYSSLKIKAESMHLSDKIHFIKKLPYAELMQYTANADLGVTLDKDSNLNYRFSLPNKLFDYIHAGIPILSSDLIEIRKIIEKYKIGEIVKDHQPETIANNINQLLADDEKRLEYAANTKIAAAELCWENEEKELMKVYSLYS